VKGDRKLGPRAPASELVPFWPVAGIRTIDRSLKHKLAVAIEKTDRPADETGQDLRGPKA
jgi:hypothetical protein